MSQVNAEVDGYWKYNSDTSGINYPLPSGSGTTFADLQYGDPTLYNLITFFKQILQSNLLPRFAQDMLANGMNHANIPNYVDGAAVAESIIHMPYPDMLKVTGYHFPLLMVNEIAQHSAQITSVKPGVERVFEVALIMPPMEATLANIWNVHRSIIAKAWMAYGQQGYDPKVSTTNAWKTAGLSFGTMGSVSFLPFLGKSDNNEAVFPAVKLTLSLYERNQLALPQNYPNGDITSVYIQENLNDGYSPFNPLLNVADGYVYPQVTVTGSNPNSGSVAGYKMTYLTGTGFTSQIRQVSLCGIPVQSFTIKTPILMLVISNPGTNTGIGNVVLTDLNGNQYTLTNGYTYT